jgi:ribosomal-protein-alanine N-acetyltransferase
MDFSLRPWRIEDLDTVSRFADNEKIQSKMSNAFPNTEQKWKAFLTFAQNDDFKVYRAIDFDGTAIGGIGVSLQNDIMCKNSELGYWLAEKYWGKGIMPQAIKKIVNLAFEKFDISRIYAAPFGNNTASRRVLEKAGFKLEARFEKIVFKNNEMLDELVYAIRR